MIVYILKHPNSEFSGSFFGVGFDKGRGSTSSKVDKDRCVMHDCKDITSKVKSIQIAQKKKEEGKAAKAKKADDLKIKKDEEKAMLKAEKEKISEEPPSKEGLEEKAEESEKEKK